MAARRNPLPNLGANRLIGPWISPCQGRFFPRQWARSRGVSRGESADEFDDPSDVGLKIAVNGETRQDSRTKYLIYDISRLIEFASSFYTLEPGDLIYTGTPAGVGPVKAGDVMTAETERIGSMSIAVRDA